jgi:hypothetical protein
MARKKPTIGIRLRLNQNAFVHGEFQVEGYEETFSQQEADTLLQTTRIWDLSSTPSRYGRSQ